MKDNEFTREVRLDEDEVNRRAAWLAKRSELCERRLKVGVQIRNKRKRKHVGSQQRMA